MLKMVVSGIAIKKFFWKSGYDPVPEKFTFKRQNVHECVDNLGNTIDKDTEKADSVSINSGETEDLGEK